jgi:hypothetical protein
LSRGRYGISRLAQGALVFFIWDAVVIVIRINPIRDAITIGIKVQDIGYAISVNVIGGLQTLRCFAVLMTGKVLLTAVMLGD